MSYSGGYTACGARHPMLTARCSKVQGHSTYAGHADSAAGVAWSAAITEKREPSTVGITPAPLREITPDDPLVVECFAFGLMCAGMMAHGATKERAAEVWAALPVEDRARWQVKSAAVIHHALGYKPA